LLTTVLSTLSLHDALPIYRLPKGKSLFLSWNGCGCVCSLSLSYVLTQNFSKIGILALPWRILQMHFQLFAFICRELAIGISVHQDRKSTRLNSSHGSISYA